jgi:RNA polymerase sigma-70 factor (ECF subfamily)
VSLFLAALENLAGGPTPSDAALMEQLARRVPEALEQLYDRHARAVFSLALRIAQQAALAEEIVQDVFLQLWRNAHQYQQDRGPLGPWLLTMTRNRALDHLRLKREKQRRREDAFDAVEPRDVRAPNPEALIDQRILTERVRTVMNELPAAQRKALELAYFDGMTHSEISTAMNEPLGTVKSWIRNGLIHLREVLEQTS